MRYFYIMQKKSLQNDDFYANVMLNLLFAIFFMDFVSIFALANQEGVVSF